MKTIKFILSTILFLFLFSSCDTYEKSKPEDFYPSQLDITDFNNSNLNKRIKIDYYDNNTISRIEIQDNSGIKTKIYSYTDGKITSVNNSGFLSGPEVRNFVYDNTGKLASIIDSTSGTTETFPISFNASTNSYTLIDGSDTNRITLDTSNNPTVFSSSFLTSNLTITLDDTNAGVFKNVAPQIALQFDLVLVNGGHLFYFFNQKQINHFQFGVQDFDLVHTRDAENNITSVVYNFTGGGSQLDITYEKRNRF